MGSIYKSAYTTDMPEGATIKSGIVTWADKRGKKKTGKLNSSGKVLIETNKWMAKWADETGRVQQKATGCTSKEMAQQFLRNKELKVKRIRAGGTTRQEITQTTQAAIPVAEHLAVFKTHL